MGWHSPKLLTMSAESVGGTTSASDAIRCLSLASSMMTAVYVGVTTRVSDATGLLSQGFNTTFVESVGVTTLV